jgi:hypothetical protein
MHAQPKLGPQHKNLQSLVGNWVGEETMSPCEAMPKGGTAQATMNSRMALNGFNVIGDYEQKIDGKVNYAGHAVWGVDPKTEELTMHWFDTMGMGPHEFRGKLENERMSVLQVSSMGLLRLEYDLREKGTMRSKMEASKDGREWKPVFEGVYHKK